MNLELTGSESGLVAYYDFNEGTGQTAFDSGPNGYDGTLGSNSGVDARDPAWIPSGAPSPTPTPLPGSCTFTRQRAWPGGTWASASPANVCLDAAKLQEAGDYAQQNDGGGNGVIVRDGRLAHSWGNLTELREIKSATKTVAGTTALGLALRDDLATLSTRADLVNSEIDEPVTLFQLVTQTAGYDKPGGFCAQLFTEGTAWGYSDCGFNNLCDTLTLLHGEDLDSVLDTEVFAVIGASSGIDYRNNIYRPDTIEGIKRRECGSGISASVDALARIGLLYQRGGEWDGQRILQPDVVAAFVNPHTDVTWQPFFSPPDWPDSQRRYGMGWWLNTDRQVPSAPADTFVAWGHSDGEFEAYIVVIPSLELVVTRTGDSLLSASNLPLYEGLAPFLDLVMQAVTGHGAE
jgi:CubicO group peptidase (beta-lactamase class C family)